jgi:putative acetyltransferase
MISLREAATAADMDMVRTLFTEYQQWLQFSLCFQGFDTELAGLPGKYAPPHGRLYLAEVDAVVCGCVALRPMDDAGACEMKRLFVREPFRGRGIGRMMTERIVADARSIGYTTMRLDTLQRMEDARALYRQLGFTEIPAYYNNPLDEVVYLELHL